MRNKHGLSYRMLHPGAAAISVFIIFTVALLVYSLGRTDPYPPVRYFSYLFSTYTLVVTVIAIPAAFRRIRQSVTQSSYYSNVLKLLEMNTYTNRWINDIEFRNLVNLIPSTIINAAFIFINFMSGISGRSVWFVALAVYYLLLTLSRTYLIRASVQSHTYEQEVRIYRKVGWSLLLYNIVLTVMLMVMIRDNVTRAMNHYLLYFNALFAFIMIINAVIKVIRYRRLRNPLLSGIKVISLFAAMFSILMLQTTMLSTYGAGDIQFFRIMTAATGAVIEAVAVGISIYMLISSHHFRTSE